MPKGAGLSPDARRAKGLTFKIDAGAPESRRRREDEPLSGVRESETRTVGTGNAHNRTNAATRHLWVAEAA
jgi:hypothetical protein